MPVGRLPGDDVAAAHARGAQTAGERGHAALERAAGERDARRVVDDEVAAGAPTRR